MTGLDLSDPTCPPAELHAHRLDPAAQGNPNFPDKELLKLLARGYPAAIGNPRVDLLLLEQPEWTREALEAGLHALLVPHLTSHRTYEVTTARSRVLRAVLTPLAAERPPPPPASSAELDWRECLRIGLFAEAVNVVLNVWPEREASAARLALLERLAGEPRGTGGHTPDSDEGPPLDEATERAVVARLRDLLLA